MDYVSLLLLLGLACVLFTAECRRLRKRIEDLQARIARLEPVGIAQAPVAPARDAPPETRPDWARIPQPRSTIETRVEPDTPEEKTVPRTRPGLEQTIAARLPVWIGGIALALSGVFLVRYSIDRDLLSEPVRVCLGGMLGLGLLYAGRRISERPSIANGRRIAQALVGAGICALYGSVYAASNLYGIIPSSLGFVGMAAITGYAVTASLRHGAPVAVLGMAGGFLTPALIHSAAPSTPLLFIYLYMLTLAVLLVIRRQGWWLLGCLAIVAGEAWGVAWLAFGNTDSEDALCMGLFLIATSLTVFGVGNPAPTTGKAEARLSGVIGYIALGGGALVMSAMGFIDNFGTQSWLLFACLTAASLALAWIRPRQYAHGPWITLILSVAMLLGWQESDPAALAWTIGGFAILLGCGGTLLARRGDMPVRWTAFTALTGLAFYLLSYAKIEFFQGYFKLDLLWHKEGWAALALVLAALAIQAIVAAKYRFADHPKLDRILAICATAATAFISLGLAIMLPKDALPIAFAAEILALGWISTRTSLPFLRVLAGILLVVFALLLAPQILLVIQLAAYSLAEIELPLQQGVPMVDRPIIELGIPAVLMAGAAWFWRRTKDDRFVATLEGSAMVLAGLTGYYLIRHAMHPHTNVLFAKADFIERCAITNALMLYGVAALVGGRYLSRKTMLWGGVILFAIGLFRIGFFDLLTANPLWTGQPVGAWPILNALLLPYGLPIAWLAIGAAQLRATGHRILPRAFKLIALGLMMILVSFEIRQLFHGAKLTAAMTGSGEVYAYSAAWLAIGIALLVAGTAREDRMIRAASLAVMLVTVGKVFLLDAAALDGLYRVASFLGLGLCLLGLSWFYSRFVFRAAASKAEE
jgi:uncharacterized membrane protein